MSRVGVSHPAERRPSRRTSPELQRREQKHVAGSRAKIQGSDGLPLAHLSWGSSSCLSPRVPVCQRSLSPGSSQAAAQGREEPDASAQK